jgi:hypothetical protein
MTAQTVLIPWKIETWQTQIATHLLQHRQFSPLQVDRITRQLILAVLWVYFCEQRGIGCRPSLHELQQGTCIYLRFLALLTTLQNRMGLASLFPLLTPFDLSDALMGEIFRQLSSPYSHPPLNTQFQAKSAQTTPICTILGQVYEQLLRKSIAPVSVTDALANSKKSAGIYYTPPAIVEFILQATLPLLLPLPPAPPPPLRLLDPACGSGAFLVAAYQYLLDWYLQHYIAILSSPKTDRVKYPNFFEHPVLQRNTAGEWQLTQRERSRILLTHLHGVDLDAQAVTVTKLCLWLMLMEDLPHPPEPLPCLDRNLYQGNALVHFDKTADQTRLPTAVEGSFDWQTAFPKILQTGGFDLVLGNPPYVDSENMTAHFSQWRSYCGQHYRTAQGNWDLFCVFIEKAIELCREGGFTSLVVPNKLASAEYAHLARHLLSQENTLLRLRDYSQVPVFATASVYPLIYVAQKTPPQAGMTVHCEVMQDLQQVQHVRALSFPTHSKFPWLLTATSTQASLLQRLQTNFPPLETIAQITGAATVDEAYQLQDLIQNNPTPAQTDLRLVNSGTIDRYCFLWGKKKLRYLGQTYLHPVVPAEQVSKLPPRRYHQAKQPKIIVAGMTRSLECALDVKGELLAGKSTTVIQVKNGVIDPEAIDLRYLLGLLNSQLLSVYFSQWFSGNRLQGGYLRVGPPQVKQLPVCIPNFSNPSEQQAYRQIIHHVDQLLHLRSSPFTSISRQQRQIQAAEHRIERLIYQLYCLTPNETQVLQIP